MIGTAAVNFTKLNNLSYYFFKSYWTLGVLCLPICLALISYIVDFLLKKTRVCVYVGLIVALGFACSAAYYAFSYPGFHPNGYDTVLHVHNGIYNYYAPGGQKKLITLYEKWGEGKGDRIYPVGMWGWTTLSFALYGDLPIIYRKFFANKQYHIGGINILNLFDDVILAESQGREPILNDLRESVASVVPSYSEYGKKLAPALRRL